ELRLPAFDVGVSSFDAGFDFANLRLAGHDGAVGGEQRPPGLLDCGFSLVDESCFVQQLRSKLRRRYLAKDLALLDPVANIAMNLFNDARDPRMPLRLLEGLDVRGEFDAASDGLLIWFPFGGRLVLCSRLIARCPDQQRGKGKQTTKAADARF